MSFLSPYAIKKILNVFRVDTPVIYVAVLDYEGNIKARLVKDENENTSLLEIRSIDSVRATNGIHQANKQFFDETEIITISNDANTEFVYFSNFVIYVLAKLDDDEEKITQIKNKIKKLAVDLQRIFDLTVSDFGKYD